MGGAISRKVALLLPNLMLGGAERQAVELAVRLPAVGWEAVVLVAEEEGPLGARLEAAGVRIRHVRAEMWRAKSSLRFWGNLVGTIGRISSVCREERVSVLQSYLFWQNQLAIPAGLITPGLRAVITGRRNTGEFKDSRRHYQLIENLTNRFCRVAVCNSRMVARDTLRRERIDRRSIRVIYNGVDADRFAGASPEPLRERFVQLRDADLVVGTVGNLKRQKRHDIFIDTIARLRRDIPGVRGVIVGRDMGEEAGLRERCLGLGLEDCVVFAGPMEEPAGALRAFDLFLLTSDHEGLPNVVLEAMAAGCAVVSTDAGGAREVVERGRTGMLIRKGDADAAARVCLRLLRDGKKREELGRAGQEAVRKRFSFEAMVEAHRKLYERLVAR